MLAESGLISFIFRFKDGKMKEIAVNLKNISKSYEDSLVLDEFEPSHLQKRILTLLGPVVVGKQRRCGSLVALLKSLMRLVEFLDKILREFLRTYERLAGFSKICPFSPI